MKTRALSALSLGLVILPAAGLVLLLTLALRAQNQPPPAAKTATGLSGTPGLVPPFNYPSTSLWMYAYGSPSNHALNGLVNGTTPGSPYFLLSRPSLTDTGGWTVEQLLIGTAGGLTPFTLPMSNRPDALFLSARPWSSNDETTLGLQITITNPINGAYFWNGPTNLALAASVSASNPVLGVGFYNQTGL